MRTAVVLAMIVSFLAVSAAGLPAAHGSDSVVQQPRATCFGKRATIVGNARANVLNGTRKGDVIVGLGGNDRIDAGAGNDLVCAGAGNDTVLGGGGADRVDGGGGRDTCRGGERSVGCENAPPVVPEGALAAGSYVTDVFAPRFGFVVGSGWSVPFGQEPRQLILLQRRDPGGHSVTFDSFARGQSVEDTISRLVRIQGVQATTPTAASVGGFAGRRVELLVTASSLVLVPGLAERYELEPNDVAYAYAIDVRGSTVTILVEAPVTEFDGFFEAAEGLLASVRWLTG